MNGKLIVFEGVEGCGKTTQIQRIYQWLLSSGIPVVVTREPGGTELGSHLRQLLLEVGKSTIAYTTELLLYAADRAQHVEQELKPDLQQGKIILCDRFTDSTVAYQGYGRSLDMSLIHQLNAIATSGLESDLTLWFDVDVEIGLSRKISSNNGVTTADRIEQEKIEFHRRVQQGYTELAGLYPQRIQRIDALLDQDQVQRQIQAILTERLQNWGFHNT
jgi:dTMP kinase